MVRPAGKIRPIICYRCQDRLTFDGETGLVHGPDGDPHSCLSYTNGRLDVKPQPPHRGQVMARPDPGESWQSEMAGTPAASRAADSEGPKAARDPEPLATEDDLAVGLEAMRAALKR